MLIKQAVLREIQQGQITLAFRRWIRPTVKAGSTLNTSIGQLSIDAVDLVAQRKITKANAQQAGYASRQLLINDLNTRSEGSIYRITLHFLGADPRIKLREQDQLSPDEFDKLMKRLSTMDNRAHRGPWTTTLLKLIAAHPETRATDLAEQIGMETKDLKTNVRKLKTLGLTQSLKIGYRLSPRGESMLKQLKH